MIANRPAEIIHMTYITVSTIKEGKVAILMSIDNYSKFCFGAAIDKDLGYEKVSLHIENILKDVKKKHPKTKPLFVMAYGKDMLPKLEEQFHGKATFLFNPVLADEVAMPPAKLLLDKLFNR